MAADLLAWLVEGLSSEQLSQSCVYNYPELNERDVMWVVQHSLHEVEHHLQDIEVGLRQVARTSEPA
jgi:hypothetical protein